MEIAGGQAPEIVDGKSMLPVWKGETDVHHEELYFSYTGVIVSKRRQETPYPTRAIRTERYRYIRNLNHTIPHPKRKILNPYEELYDLQADPEELNNLAQNSDYDSIRGELSGKIDDWMTRIGDKGIESELETLKKYPPYTKKKKNKK